MVSFARGLQMAGVVLLVLGVGVAGVGGYLLSQYDCQSRYGITARPTNESATLSYGNLSAPQQRAVRTAVQDGTATTNRSVGSSLGNERIAYENRTYEVVLSVSDCAGPWQWSLVYAGGALALLGALVGGSATAWRRYR